MHDFSGERWSEARRKRRHGCFKINGLQFAQLEAMQLAYIQAHFLIMDCQRNWSEDSATYYAISPLFDPVGEYGGAPEYMVVCDGETLKVSVSKKP